MVNHKSLSPIEWDGPSNGKLIRLYTSRANLFKKFGFETTRLESIHRQLNNYSFQKVPQKSGNGYSTFKHKFFVRDNPKLMSKITKSIRLDENGKKYIRSRPRNNNSPEKDGREEKSTKFEGIDKKICLLQELLQNVEKSLKELQDIQTMHSTEIDIIKKKLTTPEAPPTSQYYNPNVNQYSESDSFLNFLEN